MMLSLKKQFLQAETKTLEIPAAEVQADPVKGQANPVNLETPTNPSIPEAAINPEAVAVKLPVPERVTEEEELELERSNLVIESSFYCRWIWTRIPRTTNLTLFSSRY